MGRSIMRKTQLARERQVFAVQATKTSLIYLSETLEFGILVTGKQ